MATDSTSISTTTIDDLPECLLLHILSFLPTMDAMNTSSVSSKWRYLWPSTPTIDLNIIPFASHFNPSKPPSEIRHQFGEFIIKILTHRVRHQSPFHKLQLCFDYQEFDPHKYYLDSLIIFAANWKCKALILNLKNRDYSLECPNEKEALYHYPLDFSYLLNSSIEVVMLQNCSFRLPSTSVTSVRALYLDDYSFVVDSMFSELIPLCVNLEFLYVNKANGYQNINISSLSLKDLVLLNHFGPQTDESCLEIFAPNLRRLCFYCFCVGKCILRDVSSLVEVNMHFHMMNYGIFACWSKLVASITDVERLTIENMWSWYTFDDIDEQSVSDHELDENSHYESDLESDDEFCGKVSVSEEIFSENFAFNKLKYLKLLTGYEKREVLGLELCLKMCPKLETLVLDNVFEVDDDDDLIVMSKSRPIIMQIPKLRQVELLHYKGTRNEEYVVELLKKHKAVLENIIAFPAEENNFLGKPIILWTSSFSAQ